jgi:hypothetical protein
VVGARVLDTLDQVKKKGAAGQPRATHARAKMFCLEGKLQSLAQPPRRTLQI